ncbi:uncharacterized protein F5147DRAFT_195800 [Suillus discolor]|uniref:Uncharacterized protein n=1 Tax=Suillus discolor TaxID=1912936 RepID=A0A9P7JZL9_9AGAM|nr:uncharacterized protein F5147DRAFT_195800 [Suillus discolor]KAG2119044.1 hypothetical protein F5147DRAFT_195800 [Suillus discolor]
MDLSQLELPITSYFARNKKDPREAEPAKKRKLSAAADDRGGPGKRERRAAVSADTRKGPRGSAKQTKTTKKQIKFPTKSPVASTSSRRERASPPGPSHDVVVIDSSPERPVAGSSHSAKSTSNTVSHRINASSFLRINAPVHLASAPEQSLATPPPTNQTKKRTLAVSTAVVQLLSPRIIPTTIIPAITSLPTPETNVRKPNNTHAPSGLRTFVGATSPRRAKNGSDPRIPSSLSPASAPLIKKLTVPIDTDRNVQSRKHADVFNGTKQAIDSDDPFICASRDNEVVHAIPASSPDLPLKDLQSAPAIIEELVPSSQSQYLLALDATPSHKRIARPVLINCEPIPSSQSQEEAVMSMSSLSGSLLNKWSLARTEVDLPTPHPIAHIAHNNRSERNPLHQFTLGSSPATSPIVSPSRRFSCSFLATKSPRNRLSFIASPSRSPLKGTPRPILDKITPLNKPVERPGPVENVRPVEEDDSVTEPESEPEVLKPAQDDDSETEPESEIEVLKPAQDDDSETEPESEPIVRPPTEIANHQSEDVAQQPRATASRTSVPHSNPSTILSPYRKRLTFDSSCTSSLNDLMQQGAGMSVPVSRRPFLLPSRTPPPAVRDFLEMFQDDGSYPDDFPESLRC